MSKTNQPKTEDPFFALKKSKNSSSEIEKSASCTPTCSLGKLVLYYDSFACGFNPDACDSPYSYFKINGFLEKANDIAGGANGCPGKLCINSTPFRYTSNTLADNYKFVVYQNQPYNAPKLGSEIVYEAIVAAMQTGLENLPLIFSQSLANNVNEDLRLAYAGLNCFDSETQLTFDFALTNEDIYVCYGRAPFLRKAWTNGIGTDYDAFRQVIPVAKRNIANPLEDYVKLAIAYNYKENYVRWIINDQEIYRVERLGLPLERNTRLYEAGTPGQLPDPAVLLRPKQLNFGFGTFNAMSDYNPQNPAGENIPSKRALVNLSAPNGDIVNPIKTNVDGTLLLFEYVSEYGIPNLPTAYSGTNFGQGVIMCLKYVTVYLLAEKDVKRAFKGLTCCKIRTLESRCEQNALNGVNSKDNLDAYKCKGKIDNCDPCEVKPCEPVGIPCQVICIPCPPPCDTYVPHS
jgi:hypothetical protein